ncbi:hypothetical protein ACHAXR_007311 [Thalassiosira sp. AJA248-18]
MSPQQPTPFTRVDGKGLWRSWKRNFKNKRLALLDLIDNSLDAAIVASNNSGGEDGQKEGEGNDDDSDDDDDDDYLKDFIGRVHIYPDQTSAAAAAAAAAAAGGGDGAAAAASTNSNSASNSRGATPDLSWLGLDDPTSNAAIPSQQAGAPNAPRPTTTPTTTGLCIVNNSVRPIRPLTKVLEVYNSSKINSGADHIGENGVGLKQGCATLSDLSFVLVKNGKEGFVELGVIAESLQMAEGCYLPAFRFAISNNEDTTVQSNSQVLTNRLILKQKMNNLFSQPEHHNVKRCIERYGSVMGGGASNLEKGIDRLGTHFNSILDFYNNQFVFAVILDKISYGNPNEQAKHATDPINDLRASIPRTYLHIPESFDFRIGKSRMGRERVMFDYWPQRLVELSSFTVNVNQNLPWHDSRAHKDAYTLRVFVGFNRFRINSDEQKAASLHVYSRQSGRLIKYEPDARFMLGLNASGSMYCSGLTILVDDIGGNLPLNPTKQDVAFGEESHGDVHKKNLFAWIGAVTKFFYEYHLAKFENKRTQLTAKIKEFGSALGQMEVKEIDKCQLTTFNLHFKYYAKKSIRVKSAKQNAGPDTHFTLVPDRPRVNCVPLPPPESNSGSVMNDTPASKKRKLEHSQSNHQRQSSNLNNIPTHLNNNRGHIRAQMPNTHQPVVAQRQQQAGASQHGHGWGAQPYNRGPQYTNGHNQHAQLVSVPQQHLHHRMGQGIQPPSQNTSDSGKSAHHPWHGRANPQQLPHHQYQQPNPQQLPHHQYQQPFNREPQYSNGNNGQAQQVTVQQQPNHGNGGAMPRMGQGIQPPSQSTSDLGKSSSLNVGEKEVELVDLCDEGESTNNDASEVSASPVASNKEAPGDQIKEEPDDASGAADADEASNEEDEESVSSTKDYYKDLCNQLAFQLEKRKDSDHRRKQDNRRLKDEVQELKNEVERQRRLLAQEQNH